jgi:hypothetical protein
MSTNTGHHPLVEHVTELTDLTPRERGRLDHIARSVPDHHAPPSASSDVLVLRGRPLVRRWVAVVAAAEALGFMAPAAVGVVTASTPPTTSVPALLGAGLVEGVVLGAGQSLVLRRALPDVSSMRWTFATAAGAVIAYAVAMLPSTLGGVWDWPRAAAVVGAIALGVLVLLTIGAAQWLVLRQHLHDAHRWIAITAAAWLIGLAVFLLASTPLWQEGQSRSLAIAIGAGGGLLMALAMAWVTGWGLARMLAADDTFG